MGIGIGFSCSSRDENPKQYVYIDREKIVEKTTIRDYQDVNPKPHLFTIKNLENVNGNTIALVNYPNCTTFNGDKLLLIRGFYNKGNFKILDPHFLDDKHIVIGRFIPTKEGWKMARVAAIVIN